MTSPNLGYAFADAFRATTQGTPVYEQRQKRETAQQLEVENALVNDLMKEIGAGEDLRFSDKAQRLAVLNPQRYQQLMASTLAHINGAPQALAQAHRSALGDLMIGNIAGAAGKWQEISNQMKKAKGDSSLPDKFLASLGELQNLQGEDLNAGISQILQDAHAIDAFLSSSGFISPLNLGKKSNMSAAFEKIDPTKFTNASLRKFEETGMYSDLKPKSNANLTETERFEMGSGLRKEIDSENKDFIKVRDAYARTRSLDATAAGDMALVFNYMKMLDPGSTVREGEFANAQNATGIPGRIINLYNNARDGKLLSETQRKDFLTQADNLYKAQEAGAKRVVDQRVKIGERFGITEDDIFGGVEYFPDFNTTEAPPVAVVAPKTQEEYDALPDGTEYQYIDDETGETKTAIKGQDNG